LAVPQLLQAIRDMSTQFDVKLSEMQAEIRALKVQNSKELAGMKETIVKLTSEIMELRKERVGDADVMGEQPESTPVEVMVAQTQGEKMYEGDKIDACVASAGMSDVGPSGGIGESDQPQLQAELENLKRKGSSSRREKKKKKTRYNPKTE
jgi:hypothetical protein